MKSAPPLRVLAAAFLGNAVLLVFLALVFWHSKSQLVLAQGADSLQDLVAGVALWISAVIAGRPRDRNHPFGHQRAEPIGSLITAVLAGILALEVGRSAIESMLSGTPVHMDRWVLAVLAGKFLVKAGFWLTLARRDLDHSPALNATRVDTRNDSLATLSSLVGYGLVRAGLEWADAVLALPVAVYIGWSGIQLARDNLRFLMGEAPDKAVLEDLLRRAQAVTGVKEVKGVVAHYVGHSLHAEVTVLVADDATATEVHDLAREVQRQVEAHQLVSRAFLHVDTDSARDHA